MNSKKYFNILNVILFLLYSLIYSLGMLAINTMLLLAIASKDYLGMSILICFILGISFIVLSGRVVANDKDRWIQKSKALFFDFTFSSAEKSLKREADDLIKEGGGYDPMIESSETELKWGEK